MSVGEKKNLISYKPPYIQIHSLHRLYWKLTVCQISFPALQKYEDYIMRNAGLDEAQAEIKIAGRNINNLRYADDTTLMSESKN